MMLVSHSQLPQTELTHEIAEFCPWECLGKNIQDVLVGRYVVNGQPPAGYALMYEVVLQVDVFGLHMKFVVLGQCNGSLVITIQCDEARRV